MAKYVDSAGLTKAFELIKGSISSKQDALVSGTNIKTINNTSLLGSGNISISGGGGSGITLDDVYPVGSIYMSVNSTDPGTLFGGTWQPIQDTFLLAAGTNHAAGSSGGEEEHTLTAGESGTASHGHGMTQPAFTVGKHQHQILNSAVMYNNGSTITTRMATSGSGTKISLNTNLGYKTLDSDAFAATRTTNAAVTDHAGADAEEAHNNMPPYLTVYMWKRTA